NRGHAGQASCFPPHDDTHGVTPCRTSYRPPGGFGDLGEVLPSTVAARASVAGWAFGAFGSAGPWDPAGPGVPDTARTRDPHRHGSRVHEHGDLRTVGAVHADGQDARQPRTGQDRVAGPCPGGVVRLS